MLREIYDASPGFVKRVMRGAWDKLMPFPRVMGIEFARIYNGLMASQWYPRKQLEELQNEKLRLIVKHEMFT